MIVGQPHRGRERKVVAVLLHRARGDEHVEQQQQPSRRRPALFRQILDCLGRPCQGVEKSDFPSGSQRFAGAQQAGEAIVVLYLFFLGHHSLGWLERWLERRLWRGVHDGVMTALPSMHRQHCGRN